MKITLRRFHCFLYSDFTQINLLHSAHVYPSVMHFVTFNQIEYENCQSPSKCVSGLIDSIHRARLMVNYYLKYLKKVLKVSFAFNWLLANIIIAFCFKNFETDISKRSIILLVNARQLKLWILNNYYTKYQCKLKVTENLFIWTKPIKKQPIYKLLSENI